MGFHESFVLEKHRNQRTKNNVQNMTALFMKDEMNLFVLKNKTETVVLLEEAIMLLVKGCPEGPSQYV